MGGNAPGPQGMGAGGVLSIAGGTLVRTRSCTPGVNNGNRSIKQKESWSIGPGQPLRHQAKVAQIYFPTNGCQLDVNDRVALSKLCAAIKEDGSRTGYNAALLAVGSANHRGDDVCNLRLGAWRALSVKKYVKSNAPGVFVWARTVGEALAQQPDLCGAVSQQQLAEDRRVDLFYAKYKIIIGEDVEIVVPSLPDVIEDAVRIVSGKKSSYPNQTQRILCYLKKLKGRSTMKNDSYWSYGDWVDCEKYAHVNGRFTEAGLRRAAQELGKRRQSARRFLREKIATQDKGEDKFQQLLFLDRIIFDSWQKVADRLARSGSDMFFPYWVAVKNQLVDMHRDPETLYSCIELRKGSVWEYLPV
jgi:outer membrane protein OmpA-like peptidoglycan-associated protein